MFIIFSSFKYFINCRFIVNKHRIFVFLTFMSLNKNFSLGLKQCYGLYQVHHPNYLLLTSYLIYLQ